MKKRKFTMIISIVFFLFMIGMTFFAETLYEKQLPQVETSTLGFVGFPKEYLLQDGVTKVMDTEIKLGIAKEVYQQEQLFAIRRETVNGRERVFVREIQLEVDGENDTHYEVVAGDTYFGIVDTSFELVSKSSEVLMDGDEVHIIDLSEVIVK